MFDKIEQTVEKAAVGVSGFRLHFLFGFSVSFFQTFKFEDKICVIIFIGFFFHVFLLFVDDQVVFFADFWFCFSNSLSSRRCLAAIGFERLQLAVVEGDAVLEKKFVVLGLLGYLTCYKIKLLVNLIINKCLLIIIYD